MSYKRLVLNRIKTPDGTLLTSYHQHDYVTYVDDNGLEYMVDGGSFYARRNVHDDFPYEELSIYECAPFEIIRKVLSWGTRGQKVDKPLIWIVLEDMETDHIEKCLEIPNIDKMYKDFFEKELKYRGMVR